MLEDENSHLHAQIAMFGGRGALSGDSAAAAWPPADPGKYWRGTRGGEGGSGVYGWETSMCGGNNSCGAVPTSMPHPNLNGHNTFAPPPRAEPAFTQYNAGLIHPPSQPAVAPAPALAPGMFGAPLVNISFGGHGDTSQHHVHGLTGLQEEIGQPVSRSHCPDSGRSGDRNAAAERTEKMATPLVGARPPQQDAPHGDTTGPGVMPMAVLDAPPPAPPCPAPVMAPSTVQATILDALVPALIPALTAAATGGGDAQHHQERSDDVRWVQSAESSLLATELGSEVRALTSELRTASKTLVSELRAASQSFQGAKRSLIRQASMPNLTLPEAPPATDVSSSRAPLLNLSWRDPGTHAASYTALDSGSWWPGQELNSTAESAMDPCSLLAPARLPSATSSAVHQNPHVLVGASFNSTLHDQCDFGFPAGLPQFPVRSGRAQELGRSALALPHPAGDRGSGKRSRASGQSLPAEMVAQRVPLGVARGSVGRRAAQPGQPSQPSRGAVWDGNLAALDEKLQTFDSRFRKLGKGIS